MNKNIFIAIVSIVSIFFLTAQACNFGGISTGLAADCVGEGDIVCDETDAYQCQLASYGVGYYVSRASGYDGSDCGATEDEEEVDLSSYETLLENIDDKILLLSDSYSDAKRTYTSAEGTAAEYMILKRQLFSVLEDMETQQTKLADIEEALAAETADTTDLQETVDELQSDLDSLVTKVLDLLDDVQTSLDSLRTACSVDTECSGYRCKSGYCVYSCSSNLHCDTTSGYECDATSMCVSSTGSGSGDYDLSISAIGINAFDSGEISFDVAVENAETVDVSDVVVDCSLDVSYYSTSLYSGTDTSTITTVPAGDYDATTCSMDSSDLWEDMVYKYIEEAYYTPSDEFVGTMTATITDSYGTETFSEEEIWVLSDFMGEDAEGDDLTYAQEYGYGTNPHDDDTDGDGYDDGDEVDAGTDPLNSCIPDSICGTDESCYDSACYANADDYDADGLSNYIEITAGFDPISDDLSDSLVFDLMNDYGTIWDTSSPSDQPTMNYVLGELYMTFDGDDYLEFPDTDALDVTSWIIIQATVKTLSGYENTKGVIVSKNLDGDSPASPYNAYVLRQSDGQFQFGTTYSTSASRVLAEDNKDSVMSSDWRTVTGVWFKEEGVMYVYVDNVYVGEKAQTGSLVTTTGKLFVGNGPTGHYFHGDISEIKIWGE